jgi:hypothetical protein
VWSNKNHRQQREQSVRVMQHLGVCPEDGKIRYGSRKQALASNRYWSSQPGRTVRLRAYRCGRWWHTTSWSAAKMAAWKDYQAEGKAS